MFFSGLLNAWNNIRVVCLYPRFPFKVKQNRLVDRMHYYSKEVDLTFLDRGNSTAELVSLLDSQVSLAHAHETSKSFFLSFPDPLKKGDVILASLVATSL